MISVLYYVVYSIAFFCQLIALLCAISFNLFLFFFFSSRRRHTRCALVTGVQTCALPIFVVISGGSRPMFSKDLEYTIGQCYKHAREARDEYMTVEHLLLALLDNPSAEAVLKATGADFHRLRGDLEQAIASSVSRLPEDDGRDTQPTLGFQRVLQRAVYHVQSSGK